jgi:hypothetical protein
MQQAIVLGILLQKELLFFSKFYQSDRVVTDESIPAELKSNCFLNPH